MKLESMTSTSTSMSVSDVSGWQFISHLSKQRLMVRLSSAQCIEANHLVCDVYFTPYQPMNPRSVYFELTAKHADDSFIVGAANVDNTPAELCLRVELPPTWKRPTLGRCIHSCRAPRSICRHVFARLRLQCLDRLMVEVRPDLCLPSPIETLDSILKTLLARWRKDWHHSETQTHSDYRAEGIGILMGSLKACVIVKLGIIRQAKPPPMLKNGFPRPFCGKWAFRPRPDQATVHRDAVEDLHLYPTLDDQPFNKTKQVHVGQASRYVRQIPTHRRRFMSNSVAVIKRPVSFKYVANRAKRRPVFYATTFKFAQYGGSPKLAKIALVTKLLPEVQHKFLHFCAYAVCHPSWRTRKISERVRSRRLPFALSTQRWTVGGETPNLAATERTDSPYRMAATISHRRFSRLLFYSLQFVSIIS